MSQKTSTAALDSFRERQLTNRRRAPRHPAGGQTRSNEVRKQRSNEGARAEREFAQAQIAVGREAGKNSIKASGEGRRMRVILPAILRITFSLVLWTFGAATMTLTETQIRKYRAASELSLTP